MSRVRHLGRRRGPWRWYRRGRLRPRLLQVKDEAHGRGNGVPRTAAPRRAALRRRDTGCLTPPDRGGRAHLPRPRHHSDGPAPTGKARVAARGPGRRHGDADGKAMTETTMTAGL